MFKKSLAALALTALAVLAGPAAANAAGYVPDSNIIVSGAIVPGGVVTVDFTEASFTPGEEVSFTLTGENAAGATLASFRSVVNSQSLVKVARSTGAVSLDVTLPSDSSGTYTVTATGLTSGTIGTASLTVTPADAAAPSPGGTLSNTGFNTPMLVIWTAAGALLLGIALIVVIGFARRQSTTA